MRRLNLTESMDLGLVNLASPVPLTPGTNALLDRVYGKVERMMRKGAAVRFRLLNHLQPLLAPLKLPFPRFHMWRHALHAEECLLKPKAIGYPLVKTLEPSARNQRVQTRPC